MAVLLNPKLYPQQRLDLEDMNVLIEATCSDWKFFVKEFWAPGPYIVKGFAVSGLGGASPVTVSMANATLINVDSPDCYSWFTADSGAANISVVLQAGARNYLEVEMITENSTPLTKAFWDQTAQGGEGAEFNQTVNTISSVNVNVVVSTGGFSGSPNRVPIAIVDTDISNNVKMILDKRDLFFRLGEPGDSEANYNWGTQTEPELLLTLTGAAGTFEVGETVNIGTETAVVTTGGAGPTIGVILLSSDSISSGDAVSGVNSGATGTLNLATDTFTGADKNIDNLRDLLSALQTEIKAVKGTRFWFESGFGSIKGVNSFVNSVLTQASTSVARVTWDGSDMSITDSDGSPANADVIARIRMFGKNQVMDLTRQDGSGGSVTIPVADGEVVYVELPASGNRVYSGVGAGATNFKVVAFENFVLNDSNYWIAFRDGAKLYFRGVGELEVGEDSEIGDNVPQSLLDILGLDDEVTPANYSAISSGSLNLPDYNSSANESLVDRIAKLTAMLADVRQDLNITLDPGTITWDGTNIEVTGASLSIPGTTVGAAPVSINNLASTALPANSCVYVDINRSSGSALTVATSTLAALTPSNQRLVLVKNIGGELHVR